MRLVLGTFSSDLRDNGGLDHAVLDPIGPAWAGQRIREIELVAALRGRGYPDLRELRFSDDDLPLWYGSDPSFDVVVVVPSGEGGETLPDGDCFLVREAGARRPLAAANLRWFGRSVRMVHERGVAWGVVLPRPRGVIRVVTHDVPVELLRRVTALPK